MPDKQTLADAIVGTVGGNRLEIEQLAERQAEVSQKRTMQRQAGCSVLRRLHLGGHRVQRHR